MTSALAVRLGSQTPRVANYPPYDLSAAPEAVEIAARAGLVLDEWQQYVLTHGMGMRLDESWTAPKVSVWVPRQNGKGAIIEALELFWLFVTDEAEIVHSAHEHRTSAKAYRRMEGMIRRTPDLHRLVRPYGDKQDKPGYRKTNGEQQIELYDGRLLQYNTRSGTAARGFSSPKLILDEAQELDEDQMAAIMPTVSAMPNWQAWFFGTPPRRPDAWAYGLREDGESGAPRLAHFDWGLGTVPRDQTERERLVIDLGARYRANPAMGIRIEPETVEDEARPSGLGVDKFLAERLGMWKPKAASTGSIDPARWSALGDPGSLRADDSPLAVGVDIAPERDWAAIGVYARRDDGLGHVRLAYYLAGTAWIVPKLVELRSALPVLGFAMARGTYASLETELTRAGIRRPEDPERPRRGDLAVLSAVETAASCGQLIDAVRDGTLRHVPAGQLNTAVQGGSTARRGDTIAWSRKPGDEQVDITPLVAVTEARWLFESWVDLVQDEEDTVGDVW